jgi:hypothetical protein
MDARAAQRTRGILKGIPGEEGWDGIEVMGPFKWWPADSEALLSAQGLQVRRPFGAQTQGPLPVGQTLETIKYLLSCSMVSFEEPLLRIRGGLFDRDTHSLRAELRRPGASARFAGRPVTGLGQ